MEAKTIGRPKIRGTNARAERLIELMKAYGIKQQALADLSGLERTVISKCMTGVNAMTSEKVVGALSGAFELPRDVFSKFIDGDLLLADALSRREQKNSHVHSLAAITGATSDVHVVKSANAERAGKKPFQPTDDDPVAARKAKRKVR